MIPPEEGIERLKSGNLRYASGNFDWEKQDAEMRRRELVDGQEPFAVILGCSDSRVPVETIFDQRPGDLFVIRVAGNIAKTTQIGSIEYGIEILGARLVVVLGHSGCGAVQATLTEIQNPSGNLSPGLEAIISSIRPAVKNLPQDESNPFAYMEEAVHANVNRTVNRLHQRSEIVHKKTLQGKVRIVGAVYSLATGKVEFI